MWPVEVGLAVQLNHPSCAFRRIPGVPPSVRPAALQQDESRPFHNSDMLDPMIRIELFVYWEGML